MKYKPGDKVRIKTWEQMEKEYGLFSPTQINVEKGSGPFTKVMENNINEYYPDRIFTISDIVTSSPDFYFMEKIGWNWTDNMIECLVSDFKEENFISITSRFDLLDL